MEKKAKKKIPDIRVIKKTYYDRRGRPTDPWFEVQYYSVKSEKWRSYRYWNSTIVFQDKKEATAFAMRKKAGALHNATEIEVVI